MIWHVLPLPIKPTGMQDLLWGEEDVGLDLTENFGKWVMLLPSEILAVGTRWSCVCLCLYSFTCWLFSTARRLWYTWDVWIHDLLLWVLQGLLPSSFISISDLSYFTSKDITLACQNTAEKRIWYNIITQKDDIYWYRL